jgi:phosphatidylserine/phosphatidylglycerophosphate/cardiolipin synthase-like enzyme
MYRLLMPVAHLSAAAAAAVAAVAAASTLTQDHLRALHSSLHHLLPLFLIFWLQHIYHCCQVHQLIAAPHSYHQGVGICHITADDVQLLVCSLQALQHRFEQLQAACRIVHFANNDSWQLVGATLGGVVRQTHGSSAFSHAA